ncbi:MAG: hypothetical protein K2L28_08235 [Muribaculaceae bacterium]|nr:hypothetical protein [Muribaculaceae bacterium]
MSRFSYITSLCHSRSFGIAAAIVAVAALTFYFINGYATPLEGDHGTAFPSANEWISIPWVNFIAAFSGGAATIVAMLLLNKIYNVLRSMTSLYIALFAFMLMAQPDYSTQFYSGTLLAIVIPACVILLFGCYRAPGTMRRVFLIFMLLSAFASTQYCFALYIPAFLAGCAQMRIFGGRAFVAALLGIITPWWLMFGFGIITPADITTPHFSSIFSNSAPADTIPLLVAVGFTALVLLLSFILNFIKTIAYNAQARAYNGTFVLISITTVVAMIADYNNMTSYLPMLSFCAAMEATHYFSTHRAEKSSIAIFTLLAVYAALFACQTII